MSDSQGFLKHEPCPSCGSQDNLARYDDGHGYCFGCNYYENGDGEARQVSEEKQGLREGAYVPLPRRALHAATLQKFDYRVGTGAHYATYYDVKGFPVAQKVRRPGKQFSWIGDPKKATLFGQQCWKPGGKKVVVTEGEIDALSMSQAQGLTWPVVSVANGAGGAAENVAANLEFLESFDVVVFMFDSDEPGRAAAAACAEVLTPGKGHVATLPLKDASEMLVAVRTPELISAMWDAKPFRPDGIVAGTDLWETIIKPLPGAQCHYPYPELDAALRGMRKGELIVWCAASGAGKSTIVRELSHQWVTQGDKVGYIGLEEGTRQTAEHIMSIDMDTLLRFDPLREQTNEAAMRVAYDRTIGSGRWWQYEHWGSLESGRLINKMKYLAKGCGVEWIVLDHISIVVSGRESDNERKDIDVLMTNLRSFVEETGVSVHAVSHLKELGTVGLAEGATITQRHLRGSGAIVHLSDAVIAMERDQQADSLDDRTTVRFRILKDRWAGETGLAGKAKYNRETGRLLAVDDSPFDNEEETKDGTERYEQHGEF